VLVDVCEQVATVTLNRPSHLNSFDLRMEAAFHAAMWELDADETVRAIVVTGAGRAFCAGADLSGGAQAAFGEAAHQERSELVGADPEHIAESIAFWRMRTPVIAAINGAAVGLGLSLTAGFDVRFVAEDAKLGFVFARRGMVPDAGITWILPRLVGVGRALDLLLSGRYFSGIDAVTYGFAAEAFPADAVLPAAQRYARDLALNTAPAAVAATKALVGRFLEQQERVAAIALETKLVRWAGSQPDIVEGVAAFLEKRVPHWIASKQVEFPEELW
jgi:enoyl-CoA hydratase/carnithine racemase